MSYALILRAVLVPSGMLTNVSRDSSVEPSWISPRSISKPASKPDGSGLFVIILTVPDWDEEPIKYLEVLLEFLPY